MYILFLMCAMLSLTGCVVLWIPTGEGKSLAGKPVTKEQLAFLSLNVTTKKEVLNHLGSPNVIWEEAQLFAYNWVVRQGLLLWAAGGGYSGAAGAEDIPKDYALLIQFDDHERVSRFERAVRPAFKSYGDFLMDWVSHSDKTSSKHP